MTRTPRLNSLKSIFTLYLISAILYTTTLFLIQPIINLFHKSNTNPPQSNSSNVQITPRLLPSHSQGIGPIGTLKQIKGTAVDTQEVVAEDQSSLWTTSTTSKNKLSTLINSRKSIPGLESPDTITWYPPHHPLSTTTPHPSITATTRLTTESNSEDFFLSKAFSDALGPSKVIPYYYRAKGVRSDGRLDPKDITITTLVTSNRFKVFAKLVEHYQGPISATIHVSNSPETLESLFESLETMYRSSPSMSTWVDIHLVIDSFDRQFNMWRNVAKWFSRTSYVMMLDVDFWLCTNPRTRVLNSPRLLDLLDTGHAALVIPAFEYSRQSDGVDPTKFPTNKSELKTLYRDGKIDMFHKSWIPGHGPTNYTKLFDDSEMIADRAANDHTYLVTNYTHSYEPYVIYKKDGTPFCDERFIGYGGNKAACLYELYLSGTNFHILPSDFLIHQSHPYAEKTRQHERKFNRKLYTDFREEICFRKLYHFMNLDLVFDKVTNNMMRECKKIKGFGKAVDRLMADHQKSFLIS